ncbi:hypothetical protein [Pararobbsia alpina]|nr:hypothetical protein [Pararobbsia alpina]
MTKFLLASSALLLAGWGDQSLSGTYASHQPRSVELMQLTQTPDHHLTGTIRRAALNNDGRVETSTINVSGAVDGHSMTLTLFTTPLPLGENFGGTVTNNGLDFTVPTTPGSAQAGVSHFDRGNIGDYDAAVNRLTQAGTAIQAQLQHDQDVEALNRGAQSLTRDLDAFINRAQQVISRTPHVVVFYPHAVAEEQAELSLAQRLATGNSVQQGEAQAVVGQMQADRAVVSNGDDAITDALQTLAQREATLNAEIRRFNERCLDGSTVKLGDAIPDMGPIRAGASVNASSRSSKPVVSTKWCPDSPALATRRTWRGGRALVAAP